MNPFENINSFKVREITFQMQQVTFLLKIRDVKFIPIEVNNTFEAGKERIKFLDDVSFFAVSFGKILTDIPIPLFIITTANHVKLGTAGSEACGFNINENDFFRIGNQFKRIVDRQILDFYGGNLHGIRSFG